MVRKQIACMNKNCRQLFWTKTKKMFVVWRARVERMKVFLTTESLEEAQKFQFPPMPLEADPREYKKIIDETRTTDSDKSTYTVWLARLAKLETHGAFPSFAEADKVKINLKPNEQKYIEKLYVNTENYCGACKKFLISVQKRMKMDQKKRALDAGLDENAKVIPIKQKDYAGFMKYLVDQKVKEQQKQAEKETPIQEETVQEETINDAKE